MRHLLAALLMALGFASAANAYDDPKALLSAIYAPYIAGQTPTGNEQYYSERLRDIFAANAAKQAVDESGATIDPNAAAALTFDPFIEGQHSLMLDVVLGEPVISGDRAVATVSFHNFDHASLLSIAMVKEAAGWKVDDVASLGSGENWLLSWLLQYDPFSVK
ncbi:hypothetical protein [Devosia sp.]|uniref:hypothetical protein n=1 Tax=Devosia sp. TaxID=1871048 RepID=UPI003BAD7588